MNINLQGKKILVTGATGFVGSHLLPQLLASGAQVTCLVRNMERAKYLPAEVQTSVADLATGEGLLEALQGQDILIHLAALLFGTGWQSYLQANVQAAQNICQALNLLQEHSPQRIVLVSSLAATGPCHIPPGVGDHAYPKPVSAYGWSKLLTERTFSTFCRGRLIILRPPIIYGSGDKGLLPVFKGLAHGLACNPGRRVFPISCVHADDIVQALLLCCTNDKAQGIYHVSDGQQYTMDEFCRVAAQALGSDKPVIFNMPLPVLAFSATLSSLFGQCATFISQMLGQKNNFFIPHWNLDKYREAKQVGWLCDCSRIIKDLHYTPTVTLEAGILEAVEGYRKRGWL